MLKQIVFILIASASVARVAAQPAVAQQGATAPASGPKTIQMIIHPGAVPSPALRYRLLPDLIELTPGNAAPVYMSGLLLMPKLTEEQDRELETYINMPPADLPRDAVKRLLEPFEQTLATIAIAARREDCKWDMPLREQAFMALLPHLSGMRTIAQLLVVQAKLELADGNFDSAARSLATGFSMAQHVGKNGVLIETLVAASILRDLTHALEAWDSVPNAPNLFWSLAALPRPFVSASEALQRDLMFAHYANPALKAARAGKVSAEQWGQVVRQLGSYAASSGNRNVAVDLLKSLPQARAHLIEKGMPKQEAEGLVAAQAIAIYQVDQYDYWSQKLMKWTTLPFWQGRAGMEQTLQEFGNWPDRESNLFLIMLPSVNRTRVGCVTPDRMLAAQQTIESIRAHLAASNGQLPQSLDELTEEPAPIDPSTGKLFTYTRGDNGFTLESPPLDSRPETALRIEVTVAK